MILTLKRQTFTETSTIGSLLVDDVFECYSLEDRSRLPEEPKVPCKTAIPYGSYQVVMTNSRRFGKLLPELLGVPNFTGVRIHSGNKAEDTEGCILVGGTKSADWISDSTVALHSLMDKLRKAKGPITIDVVRG